MSYKLKRRGKYSKKVEVSPEHVEIHVAALIVCFLLAFLIWLYFVGISHIPTEPAGPAVTESETAPETGDGPEDTAPETEAPTPAEVRYGEAAPIRL